VDSRLPRAASSLADFLAASQLGLYNILFYFEAHVYESILFSPPPPALPTLLQYYCPIIEQYTTPPPNSCLYAIHHTLLAITISCKGQATARAACRFKANWLPTFDARAGLVGISDGTQRKIDAQAAGTAGGVGRTAD